MKENKGLIVFGLLLLLVAVIFLINKDSSSSSADIVVLEVEGQEYTVELTEDSESIVGQALFSKIGRVCGSTTTSNCHWEERGNTRACVC